jgi:hypothetical protein
MLFCNNSVRSLVGFNKLYVTWNLHGLIATFILTYMYIFDGKKINVPSVLWKILFLLILSSQALEKHLKLGLASNGSKFVQSEPGLGDGASAHCQTVYAAVKCALYRIVGTFGNHLE